MAPVVALIKFHNKAGGCASGPLVRSQDTETRLQCTGQTHFTKAELSQQMLRNSLTFIKLLYIQCSKLLHYLQTRLVYIEFLYVIGILNETQQ